MSKYSDLDLDLGPRASGSVPKSAYRQLYTINNIYGKWDVLLMEYGWWKLYFYERVHPTVGNVIVTGETGRLPH